MTDAATQVDDDTAMPSQQLVTMTPPKSREIRVVVDAVPMLDTARFEHMQRIATIMAETSMIPDSLRKSGDIDLPLRRVVANCFMVVNQAVRWGMDPFAVAQCASIVHGRLMWEGKLVAAVLDANLGVRLAYTFDEKPGDELGVVVSGTIPGEANARVIDGRVKDWHKGPKSPWANPGAWKRQLRYMGAREWARAHAPAIMLGVIADDEADESFRSNRQSPSKPVLAAKAIAIDIPEDEPTDAMPPATIPSPPPAAPKPSPVVSSDDTLPPDDDGWPGPKVEAAARK